MKQKTKHTPGPWYPHYAKGDHCLSSSVWGQEPGNQVAVIGGKSLETMNANAALVAAAPAMYQELAKQRDWLLHIMKQVQAPTSVMLGFEQSIKYLNLTTAQAEGFVK